MKTSNLFKWYFCNSNIIFLIVVLYAILNLAMYATSPKDSIISDDTESYMEPAKVLISEGVYKSSGNRLPGYPVILSILLAWTDNIGGIVVFLQVIILFTTALVSGEIAERFLPGYGLIVFILVAFNPTALLHAQKILPDNLFSFFLIVYIFYFIKTYRDGKLISAALSGIFIGLATLVRANGLLIVASMPLFLFVGSKLKLKTIKYGRVLLLCGVSLLTAMIILSPWIYYLWLEEGRFGIIPGNYYNDNTAENVVNCEMLVSGVSHTKARANIHRMVQDRAGITVYDWNIYSYFEKQREIAKFAKDIILDYSKMKLAIGIGKAVGRFYLSNSASAWLALFGNKKGTVEELQIKFEPSINNFVRKVVLNNATSITVYATIFGYTFIIICLYIIGFVSIFKKRVWEFIIIPGGYIALFTFMAGFTGFSRYRFPIDPLLAILAAYGIDRLKHYYVVRRNYVPS